MSRHRGRKSAAELAVVPISAVQRPEPPEELSAEEAEVWRLTVEGMRADWFGPEVRPLLRAYCTQTALALFLAQELRALAVGDKSFGRLAGMHARATKTMAMLATKMRLTPRSNRESTRDGRDPSGGRPRPWEF
jgi:phage terminase small subunit